MNQLPFIINITIKKYYVDCYFNFNKIEKKLLSNQFCNYKLKLIKKNWIKIRNFEFRKLGHLAY